MRAGTLHRVFNISDTSYAPVEFQQQTWQCGSDPGNDVASDLPLADQHGSPAQVTRVLAQEHSGSLLAGQCANRDLFISCIGGGPSLGSAQPSNPNCGHDTLQESLFFSKALATLSCLGTLPQLADYATQVFICILGRSGEPTAWRGDRDQGTELWCLCSCLRARCEET